MLKRTKRVTASHHLTSRNPPKRRHMSPITVDTSNQLQPSTFNRHLPLTLLTLNFPTSQTTNDELQPFTTTIHAGWHLPSHPTPPWMRPSNPTSNDSSNLSLIKGNFQADKTCHLDSFHHFSTTKTTFPDPETYTRENWPTAVGYLQLA